MENWTLVWTKLTEFNETNIKSIPEEPGVYRFSYKKDDKYYVFYVGQSDNIRKKFLEHMSPIESNEEIKSYIAEKKCYFKYAKVTEEDIRKAVERQLYKHFDPKGNKIMPDGRDDVTVNIN